MNLPNELITPEALDEAIKLLYASRPAKAAALLGLVDPENPISLAPTHEEDKLAAMGLPGAGKGIPGAGQGAGAFGSPSGFMNPVQAGAMVNPTSKINKEPLEVTAKAVQKKLVGKDMSISEPSLGDNTSKSQGMAQPAKFGSFDKRAMTEEEYLMYQAGLGPMEQASEGASLTPQQLAALGGGTVGVAAANRMRAKNVAGRELSDIRRKYIDAVRDNTLTRGQLKNLNAELRLRGTKPFLTMAPTVGIADAQLARAEKNLTGNVLKSRYRGALPLLAAGLIGTLAYNKLNEV